MISITIPGTPVAQGRARATTIGGHAHMYDPAKSRDYKNYIRTIALQVKPEKLLEGALRLEIDIYRDIPKSFSKKKRQQAIRGLLRPTTKPDASNYAKLAEDALTGIIWHDDSQIVELLVRKWYSENPQVLIEVMEMDKLVTYTIEPDES